MAKIEMTVRQIFNLGLWEKVCDYKGWDYYLLNEGIIDYDDTVEFDDQFEKEKEKKINLFTVEELLELKDSIDWMDGDSWFTNTTPKLIEALLHYETIIQELNDEYENMENCPGHGGHDSRLVLEIIKRFKGEEE